MHGGSISRRRPGRRTRQEMPRRRGRPGKLPERQRPSSRGYGAGFRRLVMTRFSRVLAAGHPPANPKAMRRSGWTGPTDDEGRPRTERGPDGDFRLADRHPVTEEAINAESCTGGLERVLGMRHRGAHNRGVDLPGCSDGDHCDNNYDKNHKYDSGAEAQILLQIVHTPICDLD
jgi:hypothetical protein